MEVVFLMWYDALAASMNLFRWSFNWFFLPWFSDLHLKLKSPREAARAKFNDTVNCGNVQNENILIRIVDMYPSIFTDRFEQLNANCEALGIVVADERRTHYPGEVHINDVVNLHAHAARLRSSDNLIV